MVEYGSLNNKTQKGCSCCATRIPFYPGQFWKFCSRPEWATSLVPTKMKVGGTACRSKSGLIKTLYEKSLTPLPYTSSPFSLLLSLFCIVYNYILCPPTSVSVLLLFRATHPPNATRFTLQPQSPHAAYSRYNLNAVLRQGKPIFHYNPAALPASRYRGKTLSISTVSLPPPRNPTLVTLGARYEEGNIIYMIVRNRINLLVLLVHPSLWSGWVKSVQDLQEVARINPKHARLLRSSYVQGTIGSDWLWQVSSLLGSSSWYLRNKKIIGHCLQANDENQPT